MGRLFGFEDGLVGLGPFAKVRLVKNRGMLRFTQKVESESVLEFPESH